MNTDSRTNSSNSSGMCIADSYFLEELAKSVGRMEASRWYDSDRQASIHRATSIVSSSSSQTQTMRAQPDMEKPTPLHRETSGSAYIIADAKLAMRFTPSRRCLLFTDAAHAVLD
eukprot:CAMPEP_0196717334 /NCGR_PEP_ID=MMETSP1091-20130531/714_1 /TAXON_ID=302021 /ORGANISM="Rhodomonas sp., Strain CCMP768" /LENGTH=114 /DNA_ID=CAMNT_0042057621 /DNA_START=11 /DNA_END=355 /DNA_ORIENTATION=+